MALVLLTGFALGCQEPTDTPRRPAEGPPTPTGAFDDKAPTLRLDLVAATADELSVDLVYARRDGQPGPRLMELRVAYPPDGLALAGSEALGASDAAGKRLVVQDEGGRLRTVLFSTDRLDRLDSGAVARFRFRRLADGPVTLSFERGEGAAVFAPAEANAGLLLGDPLVVEGNRNGGGN